MQLFDLVQKIAVVIGGTSMLGGALLEGMAQAAQRRALAAPERRLDPLRAEPR